MITRIKKISSLENTKNKNLLRYNTNLPLSIEVVEKVGIDRYKLILGKKEFTAKSKKELKPKEKYWGDLNHEKEGIVSLSNLVKKPAILSTDELFLNEADLFLSFFKTETDTNKYRNFLIEKLYEEKNNRYRFLSLTYMIVALKEGIFHLPLYINNKKILFQFSMKEEKNILFYAGFENLGAIKGIISDHNTDIYTIFKKSHDMILKKFKNAKVFLHTNINPLFNPANLLLDIKG